MTTLMGKTRNTGAGEAITLVLSDGDSTQIPLGSVGVPPGAIIIEAQAQPFINAGTYSSRAFWKTYAYNYTTNTLTAGSSSTAGGDSGSSSWTLTASVDGSRNLTLTFNTGSTSGAFNVIASVRFL
jgi:hypothetical protein